MRNPPLPLDLNRVKVFALSERKSLSTLEEILVDPNQPGPPCSAENRAIMRDCAAGIRAARARDASVTLIFGAHLVKNGFHAVVNLLLQRGIVTHNLPAGRTSVGHPHKARSLLATALRHGVPFTVHPGVGYDIITNHPMFHGAMIGRAADKDFRLFGGAVEQLDGGVVLSVG